MPEAPEWVSEYMYKEFDTGAVNNSESLMWFRKSKKWWQNYLKQIGATGFKFHAGHFEWFAFFKVKDQWWYISSGDCRYKISDWMLIRKAEHDGDYIGQINQHISYDKFFVPNLNRKLQVNNF